MYKFTRPALRFASSPKQAYISFTRVAGVQGCRGEWYVGQSCYGNWAWTGVALSNKTRGPSVALACGFAIQPIRIRLRTDNSVRHVIWLRPLRWKLIEAYETNLRG
jgi:hypothetical protein